MARNYLNTTPKHMHASYVMIGELSDAREIL